LWKNNDIKQIEYRIYNVQQVNEKKATADIVWNFKLLNLTTHQYDLRRLSNKITLEKIGNDWKISDSKEEG
jgi:hypothetical protein